VSEPFENDDAELERLLAEAAPEDAARAELRESHRQLEKDLLRLADPMPPADFLQQVMARVDAQPARVSGAEVQTASLIAVTALAAAVASFMASGASADGLAVSFAKGLLSGREVLVGFSSALSAVWRTAGLPLTVAMAALVLVTVGGLWRLVGVAPVNAKVVT
jgi:hypothetical protein